MTCEKTSCKKGTFCSVNDRGALGCQPASECHLIWNNFVTFLVLSSAQIKPLFGFRSCRRDDRHTASLLSLIQVYQINHVIYGVRT